MTFVSVTVLNIITENIHKDFFLLEVQKDGNFMFYTVQNQYEVSLKYYLN